MRASLLPAASLLALAAGASPSRADPGTLTVTEARVAFRDGGAAATLRLRGDLLSNADLASWDPDPAGVSVSLGPTTLAGGDEPGARARIARDRRGSWTLVVRRAWGGKGTFVLRMIPASGRFALAARGFPAADLAASGPGGVAFVLSAGSSTWSGRVDFEVTDRGGWAYAMAPSGGRPPPGGGSGEGGGPPPAAGNFQTVASGSYSGIRTFRFEAVFDDATWQALWLQHAGSGPAPPVDFSTDMVIGFWLGDRPSTGYRAEVLSVASAQVLGVPGAPPGYMATLRETQPGYNTATLPVVTQPFHIVRLPRTSGGVMYELVTVADG